MKNIFNFKKTIKRPDIGETITIDDEENEKPTFWNKKNIIVAIYCYFK